MQPSHLEDPGLEGPDYLALVIEWDDDVATLVRAKAPDRAPTTRPAPTARQKIATVLGALAAIAVATWGIHHLRAAS